METTVLLGRLDIGGEDLVKSLQYYRRECVNKIIAILAILISGLGYGSEVYSADLAAQQTPNKESQAGIFMVNAQGLRFRTIDQHFKVRAQEFLAKIAPVNNQSASTHQALTAACQTARTHLNNQDFLSLADDFSTVLNAQQGTGELDEPTRLTLKWLGANALVYTAKRQQAVSDYESIDSAISSTFKDQPLILADFLESFATACERNGDSKNALVKFRSCFSIRMTKLTVDDPLILESLVQIALTSYRLGDSSPQTLALAEQGWFKFIHTELVAWIKQVTSKEQLTGDAITAQDVMLRESPIHDASQKNYLDQALAAYAKSILVLSYALAGAHRMADCRLLSSEGISLLQGIRVISPTQHVAAYMEYGTLMQLTSQYALAEYCFKKCQKIADDNQLASQRLNSRLRLAQISEELSDPAQCLYRANDCLQVANECGETGRLFKSSCFVLMANSAFTLNAPKLGYRFSQDALNNLDDSKASESTKLECLWLSSKALRVTGDGAAAGASLREFIQRWSSRQDTKSRLYVAKSHSELAEIALAKKDDAGTEENFRKALNLYKTIDLPEVLEPRLRATIVLADLAARNNAPSTALLLASEQALYLQLNLDLKGLTLGEQLALCDLIESHTSLLLTYCTDPTDLPVAYRILMNWRGLIYRCSQLAADLEKTAISDESVADRERLKQLNQLLLVLQNGQISDAGSSVSARLKEERTDINQRFALQPLALQKDPVQGKVAKDVSNSLRDGETFLDIYRIRNYSTMKSEYCCLILQRDQSIKIVRLPDADSIDSKIVSWRKTLIGEPPNAQIKPHTMLALIGKDRSIAAWGASKSHSGSPSKDEELAARKEVLASFQPLCSDEALRECKSLTIAPDGNMSIFPWNLIFSESAVTEVSSARELLASRAHSLQAAKQSALVIGGINYVSQADYLLGTSDEAKHIASIKSNVTCKSLVGDEPDKDVVKSLMGNYEYVHIGCHGFFKDEPHKKLSDAVETTDALLKAHAPNRNPFDDSGLILAPVIVNGQRFNSVLTAQDIMGMSLSSVRLATLSACDTGLGTAAEGQGPIGMRTALMSAGASCVLMSLWEVDDASTDELMNSFYRYLWEKGLTPAEALVKAQKDVADNEQHDWKHPYYWSGWVLTGNAGRE